MIGIMGVRKTFSKGEDIWGFFQNFSRAGTKVVKFVFPHSKLRKQPFFAEIFKIQGARPPLPTPIIEMHLSVASSKTPKL